MSKRSDAVKAFRDIDDVFQIFTGMRIKDVVKRTVDLIGDDIKNKVEKVSKDILDVQDDEIPATGPYSVLHCRPGSSDAVVKLRFRELARILHPDTGTSPDAAEFQKVVEAYDEIMKSRRESKTGTG